MAAALNPAQLDAVNTTSGPVLVLAGAGTGKTRVITFRLAELIRRGIVPNRVLSVTFTNKASREMQSRAQELLGKKLSPKPEISTFHSLCMKILRRHITRLGYPARFAICDRGDQETHARGALRAIRVEGSVLAPGDLLSIISQWKSLGVRPSGAIQRASNDREHLAASAYKRYQEALFTSGSVDFDDLLLCVEELFVNHPDVLSAESNRYDHLMIDEYQDTNGLQYRLVKALAQRHRNLCVVGDDDQSIYGWRGAEVTHILNFKRDWPDAKVVRLEENYRSRAPILNLANTLIAFNRNRHDKVLRPFRTGGADPRVLQFKDETDEAVGVVNEIRGQLEAKLAEPADFAILFRTNEQPRPFEMELRRAGIPYTLVGGQSFYDRKEVRDLLAFLKLLHNPRDELSLLRIINIPPRGISPGTVKKLMGAATAAAKPMWEILKQPTIIHELPQKAAEAITLFRNQIRGWQTRLEREPLSVVFHDLLRAIDYESELIRCYKQPEELAARRQSVQEVRDAIAAYEHRAEAPSLDDFLSESMLSDRDDDRFKEDRKNKHAVVLQTLHSAKGLEFPYVYLVGMEENLLPHHRSVKLEGDAIDEERRLCYVGITRAIEKLTLTFAVARTKWGKLRPTIPSQFLFEMQGQADNPKLAMARRRAKEFERQDSLARARAGGARPGASGAPKKAAGKRPPPRKPGR